jgi:prepilin-type processing-associated H-X9-DG protein
VGRQLLVQTGEAKLRDHRQHLYSPTGGHTTGLSYAFVDGHAKLLTFRKVRADDFNLFKAAKPAETFSP